MSFSPLPDAFEERAAQWAALPVCRLVDLGSGQGEVAGWLGNRGLEVWGLDRYPLAGDLRVDVRGEALRPPFRSGELDGLLAANLMHHALAQDPSGSFLKRWLDLLNPRGRLFLWGDEPVAGADPAVLNYHKLQAFLAEMMPRARGPLVPVKQVVEKLQEAGAGGIRQGLVRNRQPVDTDTVLAMLAGTGAMDPDGAANRLVRQIRQHGLDLGKYWWVEAQGPLRP